MAYIPIGLASPQKIRTWSRGEVLKPETINYKTLKYEKDGLFCEKTFGPSKDYTCQCGNVKRYANKGRICENCGVECIDSKVRRERMGHIELAAPTAHYYYFKTTPNYIAAMLNMPPKKLETVIYCYAHLVIDPGDTELEKMQLLSGKDYDKALFKYGKRFRAGIGAQVIKELLEEIDLKQLSDDLKEQIEQEKTLKREKLIKRLNIVDMFLKSDNRPEWMIFDTIPVIPPDLRPMVQLDGGRFTTVDLNDLYRRIINRNNRLRRLIERSAPSIIINNEKRMLQEAVDALIDNKKRGQNAIKGQGNRVLKSLSDALSGKQGLFRQNLLGKRVDFSGRSVIVVGPKLRLNQCGIPREMAIELFRPFVMRELIRQERADKGPQANRLIEKKADVIWDVLDEVVKHHPVLLNRAPTLHRLSMRAFEVKIIEGEAITLHPLVCAAFNADFDGDQMAVHVPMSLEAQTEARVLMLASENLLHPQNGDPAVPFSQDMVLGCHYLSIERDNEKGEGLTFGSVDEALAAYEEKRITLHSKVILLIDEDERFHKGTYIVTTVGKMIFNQVMPKNIPYINDSIIGEEPQGVFDSIVEARDFIPKKENKPFGKGFLKQIIGYVFDNASKREIVDMLDGVKDVGFEYATKGGLTISLFDINIPESKYERVRETEEKIREIETYFGEGQITGQERYEAVIALWSETSDAVAADSIKMLSEDKMNHIRMMLESGARGNPGQHRQLAGMRGLMADPSGKTIEKPIKANFTEGLSEFEFFISTHGARKGLADTSLRVADSGYLTRRLVDVSQEAIITEEDCNTEAYTEMTSIGKQVTLEDRIIGRFIAKDVVSQDGKIVAKRGTFVTRKIAKGLAASFDSLPIRTALKCETKKGICSVCYGENPATRNVVELGEAVGVIAAQSIGEPATQLTMRTFHSGGVAGNDITQGLPRIVEIFEARKMENQNNPQKSTKAILSDVDGVVEIKERGRLKDVVVKQDDGETKTFPIPFAKKLAVKNGDRLEKGDPLTLAPINPHELLRYKSIEFVQKYLLEDVQRIYRSQGVEIADKHIECIIRQMCQKVSIINAGDSEFVPGKLANLLDVQTVNKQLEKEKKTPAKFRHKILGITPASLSTDSFLSAASFQQTSRTLAEAAIQSKKDHLIGLKESVITGKLIPAGTGFRAYLPD